MNRHHPYNQSFENPRRGANPSGGFGPDRNHHRGGHRGGGRNPGRNRGGSSFNNSGYDPGPNPYDQGPPPQGDSGPYNNYSNMQDPYYQNGGGYNAGPPDQYGGGAQDGYGQGYSGSFEDGPDGNYDDRGGYGMRSQQGKRPVRRERDDKVHDSIIEERIQRERPCRTLFIRNIKYETNSDDVRRSFEEHGDIKTFFDLISTRGMVFVTYFDLRAAERARERLQGSEISGRPIDVHYSLPREDSGKGSDKTQQFQGSLIVALRNSASGQGIDDNEIRRRFQQMGDVKSVMPGDHPAQRYVEFYDIRACDVAFDRLNHQPLQDGMMEITYGWEEQEVTGPATQRQPKFDGGGGRDWDDGNRGGGPHGRRGHRGGRGRGKGRAGGNSGGGGYNDGWERKDDWAGSDRRRFDDDFRGGRGGRGGGGGGGYGGDRFDNRGGPNSLPPGPGGPGGYGPPPGYGEPPSGPSGYSAPPPNPPTGPQPGAPSDRLEQARQVQQLLAALKQPVGGGAPPMNAQPAPPPPTTLGMPPVPPPQNGPGYYPPPPPSMSSQPPYPGIVPPHGGASAYGSLPPPPQQQQQPSSATPPSGLPPNILALLQQQSQGPPTPGPPPAAPPPGHYGMPPPMMSPPPMSSMPPGGSPAPSAGYQGYMGYMPPKRS